MNDNAKIAALRAALKDIRANSTDNHAAITADRALTADDAEQAPGSPSLISPLMDTYNSMHIAVAMVKEAYAKNQAKRAVPTEPTATADSAPFGYVVRATCRSDKQKSIFRQRVFKSAHDQEQCYRQWLEQHADRLTPFNGVWWEVSKHTVYEVTGSAVVQPWQDRMAAHFGQGKSVQCHPASYFMQREIDDWRNCGSAADARKEEVGKPHYDRRRYRRE